MLCCTIELVQKFWKEKGGAPVQVYEKVLEYIDTHHLEQKSVADAAGIPNVTFNAILTGKRKMYVEDLKAICFALNVKADVFMELESNDPETA